MSRQDPRILVVDDDVMIRDLLAAILTAEGYSVTRASSGAEALWSLRNAVPDLIISDIMMPQMDGFALVSRLRSESAAAGVPVLFLTSHIDPTDAASGLRLAAGDFVRKPFAPQEIVDEVKRTLASGARSARSLLSGTRDRLPRIDPFLASWSELPPTDRTLLALEIDEAAAVMARFGDGGIDDLVARVVPHIESQFGTDTPLGVDSQGRLAAIVDGRSAESLRPLATSIATRIVSHVSSVAGERVTITPRIGLAAIGSGGATEAWRRALVACHAGGLHLDLQAVVWSPDMEVSAPAEKGRWRSRWWPKAATPVQILITLLLGVVGPFLMYQGLYRLGIDVTATVYVAIVLALAITGAMIWMEGFYALDPVRPPREPGAAPPPATAIIAAYLPNEAATIVETIERFLDIDYPDLQVILAYNTPRGYLVERSLRELAMRDRRFVLLRVEGSTSKAQNVNAALRDATGEFIGLFDADHHPAPDSFARAWRWLSNGYDVVQGHCSIRNGDVSGTTRTVAVEFESIYAVSHPGRWQLHGFGIFGGSNGYWRAEVLRRTRMHGFMLTEDIDSSLRVVMTGGKIANDPALISRELAPTTWHALWNQRMRWAQGWFQVSRKHLRVAWRSTTLTGRQKMGMTFLLGWREVYPWISIQMFPLIGFLAWRDDGLRNLDWFIAIFVLSTLFTTSVGPGQTLFAHRLGVPEVRRNTTWFWRYLFFSSLFYTEWKNTIARVAQVKEFMGERHWKVTPRAPGAPGAAPAKETP